MKRAGRKSMVGGIVALSMILMGTGYAYWTDTLQITTKATTGEMDVTFADLALYAQYDNENPDGWSIIDGIGEDGYVAGSFFERDKDYNEIAAEGTIEGYYERADGYNEVEFTAELAAAKNIKKNVGEYKTENTLGSKSIMLNISEMYPGYAQTFRTDILNTGNIAAKLADIEFNLQYSTEDGSYDYNINNQLGIALLINDEQSLPESEAADYVFKLAANFDEGDVFEVGGVEFVRLSALKDLDEVLENNTILVEPTDERMDLYLGIAMDPETTKNVAENEGATIRAIFDWIQFNAGKDVEATNILTEQNN